MKTQSILINTIRLIYEVLPFCTCEQTFYTCGLDIDIDETYSSKSVAGFSEISTSL